MFADRYFPTRYFAPRYFPKVGSDAAVTVGGGWAEQADIFVPGADDVLSFQPGAFQASIFLPGSEAVEGT